MTDEKAKPPGSLLTDATAVHPRWYGPTPPAFPAQLRAEDEERDIQRRLEESRRVNEWEQTPRARHLGWHIFSPDWPRVVEHDALSLRSLVALSVGLTPYFASEAWVFNVALPHFKSEHAPDGDADPPELVHDKEKRSDAACRLDTFIRRLSVARSGCSAGTLRVCDNGPAGPIVLRAEFVRFAEGKRWSLPAELAASAAPLSTEYAVPAEPDTPPAPASEQSSPDLSMLTTRDKLIDAFGAFTGMDATWFDNLKDTPALYAARKVQGQGGRGHIEEPWFCPLEVMQWLINPKRKKGRPGLSEPKGWELLEKCFSKVYTANSVGDPREN